MGDFELDTRVEGGSGRYHARLSRDWEIWGPNGGYLAAIALRAAGREARIPRPASLSGHFLSVAEFAPVQIQVAMLRAGRRSESLRVTLRQGPRTVFEALVRTAAEAPGLEHDAAAAPEVPPPENLPEPEESGRYPFWNNLEARWVRPRRVGAERRAHPPHWISWHRFRPRATFVDPFVDAARYLVLVDTLCWPAASLPHTGDEFRAPSLDISVWFHGADPEEGWLLAEHASHVARGGLMGAEGRVWSRSGGLLASGGAQLYCVPSVESG